MPKGVGYRTQRAIASRPAKGVRRGSMRQQLSALKSGGKKKVERGNTITSSALE